MLSCVSDGLCVCSFVSLVVLCVFHLLRFVCFRGSKPFRQTGGWSGRECFRGSQQSTGASKFTSSPSQWRSHVRYIAARIITHTNLRR